METDPASLDPELRTNRYLALMSAALGVISLCAAIIPLCGAAASAVGLGLGLYTLKSESRKIAIAGIALSALGLLTTVIYALLLLIKQAAN
ncbi:MAG: hypothetical protein ACOYZ8_10425 [Chloroflexota bacterium]